jgi:CheY-like chemotaxis protein
LKIILKYVNSIDTDSICEIAFNGASAIELIKEDLKQNQDMGTNKSSFDLIFMDCNMPMMDGYEATGFIRQYLHGEGAPQPIISALTGHTEQSNIDMAIHSGMNQVLKKPIDHRVVSSLLKHLKFT